MDYNAPPAADVDAFAAVLKGDIGGAAGSSAAAAYGMSRSGNGTLQPLPPQSPPATAISGNTGSKPVPVAPTTATPGQQPTALQWSQLTPQQQQEIQRRTMQQRMHHQQQQQQQQQKQQQQQQMEPGAPSTVAGNRKGNIREGISFTALMPLLQPHLPPEQGQQLSALYLQFKRNEITREDFIRGARVIAGDQVLVQTIRQMHMKQQQQQQLQQQQQQQALLRSQHQQQHQQLAQTPSTQPSLLPPPQPQGQAQSQPQVQALAQPQTHAPAQSQGQAQSLSLSLSQSPTQGQTVQPQAQAQQVKVHAQEEQISQTTSSNSSVPPPSPQELSKQPQEQTGTPLQTISSQIKQPVAQTFEAPESSGAQQSAAPGLPRAVSPQPLQVPSNADVKSLPQSQAFHPVPQVPSSLAQVQGSTVKQGDQQQESAGLGLPTNLKTPGPINLQTVKQEVEKMNLGRQQQMTPNFSSPPQRPSATGLHQMPVVPAAVQIPQPFTPKAPPQQPPPGQATGHLQMQQTPAVAQGLAAGTVSQPHAQPQPAPQPTPPEKPLTKYAKQKLRKEQKKREEEERARKAAEEERLRKQNQSSTLPNVHQGLVPQHPTLPATHLSSASVDLNKQAYGHHPGSLSQQVTSQVDKQQGVPLAQVGAVIPGQSGTAVKQELSDLQSDSLQKRQGMQLSKGSVLGQTPQKPGDTSLLSAANASHMQVQGSSAEAGQVLSPQGSAPGPFSNLVQPGGVGSLPNTGVMLSQSTVGVANLHTIKQVGGQRGIGSVSTAVPAAPAYNATSLHPTASLGVGASLPIGAAPGQNAPAPSASVPGAAPTPSGPVKTPSKKANVGQKKPAENSPAQQPSSKKQKVSTAGEPDQSIDQLNDVTAVSGVNLKEEEEQLLVGPKEESRTTEAMRKIVQEEEERLFLDRSALRLKLGAIAGKCNIKSVSEDVERCISMAVEERLRSMLYKLSKLSKQRCDVEKDRHKICITSDVRRQLLLMKRRAKELQEKKLAEESERLRRLNEKKDKGSLPDTEREELRAKAQKAQQEEEDRLKANAANVAARVAVGADDMLLKWQMMAEQGRQKRQGGDIGSAEENAASRAGNSDGTAGRSSEKKVENGDAVAGGSGTIETDSQGPPAPSATGRPPGPGPGATRMMSANGRRAINPSGRGQRTITLKDVIAYLETEPQMSKSDILYRLYERERKPSDGDRTTVGNRK
ncbi:hypothetical protein Mapa_010230 [Marchantia paleacea]|nr:hypothetical protein Mapa_010230 [Marchantia paleacea]